MAIEKFYVNEELDERIEFYATCENKICIRFIEQKDCNYTIDLDLETIEEFLLDLQFEIQKIKSKGGQNG
jgi:archaellum component FlaC